MWSEWVSPETIDSRIWPRTAAIAERFWSPQEVNEVDDMYRRLAVVSLQLEELGMTHKRNQHVLLRRLVGNDDISALQTLVSLTEPVKQYQRYQQRPQSMLSPLTGLIDAAQADSSGTRDFNSLVERYLNAGKSSEAAGLIRMKFEKWEKHGKELELLMSRSPALFEAKQLPTDLRNVAKIGNEALEMLSAGKTASAEWHDNAMKAFDAAAKPKAAVRLQIISGLRKLVGAASGKTPAKP